MAGKMNIGGVLSLSGEKEFRDAISAINKDAGVLKSEFQKVTAEFADNAKGMESLTSKSGILNKQFDEQKLKVGTLKDALANASKEYGEADNKTKDWTIKLNNAEAELSKTESALKANESAIKNFDKAQADAIIHSNDFKDAQEKLNGACNKVLIGVTAAVVGFGALIAKSVSSADSIQKTADVFGMTAERVQELTYVGTKLDVELDVMTKAQQLLTKNMYLAKDGTGAQSEAFALLGLSVTDSSGNLRDSQVVMAEAITSLGKMENGTQRDALAMQIFGKSAMELNPLIKAGGDEIARLTDEAHKNGAVMSNEAVAGLDSFGDSVDAMGLSLQGIIGSALAPLAPKLQEFAEKVQSIDLKPLSDALGWIIDHGEGIVIAVGGVVAAIVTYKAIVIITTATQEIHNAILIASALAHGGLSAATVTLTTLTGGKTLAVLAAGAAAVGHTIAVVASTVAHGAASVALGIATAAQWAFNVALSANPIGVVILALAAIGAAIAIVVTHWKDICEWIKKAWDWLTFWNNADMKDKEATVTITEVAKGGGGSASEGAGAGRSTVEGRGSTAIGELDLTMGLAADDKESIANISTSIADAAKGISVDITDTVQDVIKKIEDAMKIAQITADATAAMQKELTRVVWDSTSGSYLKKGQGSIDWGGGNITRIGGEKITPAAQNKQSGKTINNQPIINIYQPVKSPYETARAVKQTMNQLVYE